MIELLFSLALSLKVLTVFGVLIALFYKLATVPASKPGDMPREDTDVDLPSIYVDEKILYDALTPKILESLGYPGVDVPIKELITEEYHRVVDDIVQFEVYRMENDDVYCSTPSGSEECEDQREVNLPITLHPVASGYVVNGSCFLSWQQWNTLVTPAVSVNLLYCVVCSQYCELDAAEDHVATSNHRLALQDYPPIDKFDLSVARKIRDHYHCAVCNEMFDVNVEKEHFSGKIHGGNVLFSINKASDLLDSSDTNIGNDNKLDTYHFKTHAMNSPTNGSDINDYNDNFNFINFQNNYYFDEYEDDTPIFTGLSYATMAKKPKVKTEQFIDIDLGSKKVTVRYDSWNMVINPDPKSNRFWCMVCKIYGPMRQKKEHCDQLQHKFNLNKCAVVEEYEEYFIRQVDDKLYHCGHCNNLQMIHEMEDHVESVHPRKKNSDTKNVVDTPLKNKPSNITDGASRNTINDNKNTINTDKDTVNDTKNTIKDNKNTINTDKSTVNTKNTFNDSPRKQQAVDKSAILNKNTRDIQSSPYKNTVNNNYTNPFLNTRNDAMNKNNNFSGITGNIPSIYDNKVLYLFDHKITVSSLAYNVCCKRPADFYCGLCDIICPEVAITQHVYELRHLEALQRTPFIKPFSFNLIRAIRDALHCTICNIPVSATTIYAHLQEKTHIDTLSNALTQAPKLPPIGVKIPNVPDKLPKHSPNFGPHNLTPNMASPNHGFGPKLSPRSTPNLNPGFNANNANVLNNMNNVNNFKPQRLFSNTDDGNKKIPEDNSNNVANKDIYNKEIEHITKEIEHITKEITNHHIDDDARIESESDNDEMDDINRTIDSIVSDASFDQEEHVYLKLKNTYIKIANTAYNTLVHVGDGSRYCFVCSVQVQYVELQKHVDGRHHLENMEKYRFLDKYEDHLLRQIYLMYHCAICNVIISRKELKAHLEWPTHALQNDTIKNIKKTRKTEIKGGVKQIVVSTQKENIYLHDSEPKIKICLNVQISNKTPKANEAANDSFIRKNKIIIFNDNVLKVSWENWHAISRIKNGYKCILCQRELKNSGIDVHCTSEWHRYGLDKPFEKQYAPALIRKINESTLNCVFCNTEVSNKPHLVHVHTSGKKHISNYEAILKDSSLANTYTDCQDDVLML